LKKKTKIAFIDGNLNFLFFTLRVAQTVIQLKNKYIVGCTTRNVKGTEIIITGCTICNVFIFWLYCGLCNLQSEKKDESQLPLMKAIFIFFQD